MVGILKFGKLKPRLLKQSAALGTLGALLIGGAALVQPTSLAASTSGRALFKAKCAACHSTSARGGPSVGPHLFRVVGRKAGTQPGFRYSKAMKKSGIVWTGANLKKYIASPRKLVPGNHMPYPGDRKAAEVNALVAYLKTLK